MTEDRLDKDRICRFFKGERTGEDEKYIRKIFCNDALSEELATILRKQWYESISEEPVSDKNLDHILYRIHYEINTVRLKSDKLFSAVFKWATRIAAIFLLPLAVYVGIHFYKTSTNINLTWTEIKAPAWTRAKFTLPDSTVVWLNSKSSIKYRGDYISERTIILDGEAYFNVRTNKSRPFTVNTDDLIIKALGTKFNVASYNDEKNLEVVLEEGELLINDRKLNISVQMVPDELVTYNKEKDNITSENVQTRAYVSWTEGKLVFRNDPIDVIARRLGRWYNIDVDIEGDNFDKLRLRATFVDENLEEVLYFLKLSLPIDYKIIEGGIISDDNYSKKKVEITVK